MDDSYDVTIVGSGPAGLAASIYTSRDTLKTCLLDKAGPGGLLSITDRIDNYPGFPEGIEAYQLIERLEQHSKRFGTEFYTEEVLSVEPKNNEFEVRTGERMLRSKTVIVASGSTPRMLNVPGEKKYMGKGVSYCAICDAAFFKKKDIVVVGGGDSALEEALFLTKFVSKLTIVHRRDALRATKGLQEQAFSNDKISFAWDSVVDEIVGENTVRGVRLKNVKDGTLQTLDVDGVFVFIGHTPNTNFLGDHVKTDESGQIIVNFAMETATKGIFAIGDIRTQSPKQIGCAVGDAITAAINIEKYLRETVHPS